MIIMYLGFHHVVMWVLDHVLEQVFIDRCQRVQTSECLPYSFGSFWFVLEESRSNIEKSDTHCSRTFDSAITWWTFFVPAT